MSSFGGGDGGASKAAAEAEAKRQAQIDASTKAINQIYNSPALQAQYDKLGRDTTNYYTGDVNRQNTIAARNLKFSLARSGLAGGSQQLAEGTELSKDYQNALLKAAGAGQAAEGNLKATDENTRQTLLGLAQTGADTSTLSQQASSSLLSNLQSGQGTATANSLGNLFGNTASIYQNSLDQQTARNLQLYGYGGLIQPSYGYGSPTFGAGGNGAGGYGGNTNYGGYGGY